MAKAIKFECPECDAVFDSLNARSGHITGKHRNSEREWNCETCGRVFTGPGPLGLHYKAAHAPGHARPHFFPCEECERVFTTASGRSHHTTVAHSGVLFPCDYCERKFTTSSGLSNHVAAAHQEQENPSMATNSVDLTNEVLAEGEDEVTRPDPLDIVSPVIQSLWPDGLMPIAALQALMDWHEDTARFLESIGRGSE